MNNADMPAYPNTDSIVSIDDEFCEGLTKREAFRMAALQGLCANPNLVSNTDMIEIAEGIKGGRIIVEAAYALADRALQGDEEL